MIMAVVAAYVIEELAERSRMRVLAKFGGSDRACRLLEEGVRQRKVLLPKAGSRVGRRRKRGYS